ncbi:MAG: M48 family metalloprotease [Deltaproteobacteria bacterium]|nr:M48 family metalloprotease [Deltaproteobacteria bacterium]
MRGWLLIVWAGVMAASSARGSVPSESPEQFETRVTSELAQQDAEAARAFAEANKARAAQDWAKASALYAEVTQRAPSFSHALRRRCGAQLALGERTRALSDCRKALEIEKSPENQLAVANALSSAAGNGNRPSSTELDEAQQLVSAVVRSQPDDLDAREVQCQVALQQQRFSALGECSGQLVRQDPARASGHFFGVLVALQQGEFDEARACLARAKAAGLEPEMGANLERAIDENQPWTERYLPRLGWLVLGWIVAMGLLIIAGWILSWMALRAASRPPAAATGQAVGLSKTLRRLYAVVLWLGCAYYYVSVPLMLVAVVALGGGLIYAFFAIGRIPIKLVAIIGCLVLVTVWAVLKSLFVRSKDVDPGRRLDLAQHPRLAAVLAEVAQKVGTPPVDQVFLTPTTDLAVFERGSMLKQLRGQRERCLILGAAVLEGMPVTAFKGILAHEYGHLSNRDTAGGGFALAVRRSLLTMARALAEGGAAAWYNPAWLFLNGFYRVFLRISHGASRLQEVLADRWAALCYGAAAFEAGLRHVIERSIRFDAHAQASLKEVIDGSRALVNLYRYVPSSPLDEQEIERAIKAALDAAPSAYDSHPAPSARFAYVKAVPSPASGEEPGTAWELLEDHEALEREMTDQIRSNVAENTGIVIPTKDSEPASGQPVEVAKAEG